MTDPLDRPIWNALKGRQAAFALGVEPILRFRPEVSPFAACADDSPEAQAALARMLQSGERAMFIERKGIAVPHGMREVQRGVGVQMIADQFAECAPPAGIIPLSEADAAAMLALASLTKPGPFRARTHDLGQYWGVKDERGVLLAMAGERLLLPGMAEVSGVCTHPDARGRGFAALLSRHVASEIARRGEVPFLHVYASNAGAIGLYEKLGFRRHGEVEALMVERM